MTDIIARSIDDINQIPQEIINREEDGQLIYGWKCITCPKIQYFNKPGAFLINLCIITFVQSIISVGYNASTVTSIEKEFGLSSTQISTFQTAYLVTGGIFSIFIGYLCSSHKPRYIGCGILFLSIGCLIICLPKLLIGSYRPIDDKNNHFCRRNTTSSIDESCNSSGSSIYQLIFTIGYILYGIGIVPLYTIACSHIDQIFSRELSAKYIGVFMAIDLLGMACGYAIAMPILRVWVDIYQPPNPIHITHSNWVGAWWVGFLVGAFLFLLIAIPMFGFPSEFPETKIIRVMKKNLPDTIATNEEITSMWTSTKALLKNKVFIFITLGTSMEHLSIVGLALFTPKIYETQFHLSVSSAAIYSGIPAIIGGVSGRLFSGFIIKKYKLNCKQIIRYGVIAALLATVSSIVLLVPCNINGVEENMSTSLQSKGCNDNCKCEFQYHPICTSDKEMFYSPCYAGCRVENEINNTFHNCTCFAQNITYAEDGRCTTENCDLFPLFMVVMCINHFFIFVNDVPYTNITLRIVNEGQGSAALGFQKMVVHLIGMVPSPVIYAAFVDRSCMLWATDKCQGKANCFEYNTNHFRYYFFGIMTVLMFLSFCCLLIADKLYELPNLKQEVSQNVAMDNIAYSTEERN